MKKGAAMAGAVRVVTGRREAATKDEIWAADRVAAVNEVRLVGRVSAPPQSREMPSGDTLVSLRVVVARAQATAKGARSGQADAKEERPRAQVDTIDVACWSAASRRSALRLKAGEVVEVTGALRRRFFRAGGGAVSRYEVEAVTLTRQ